MLVCRQVFGKGLVGVYADVFVIQNGLDDRGIAIFWNGLETVGKIVVETYWQAFENTGGQLGRVSAPLFLGIAFKEGFIQILADKF